MTAWVVCLIGVAVLMGPAVAARGNETRIELPNRTFDPSPGVEQALRDRLAVAGLTAAVEAIVQLVHVPTPQDRKLLSHSGVELGAYVGGVAFITRIRPGTDPGAIPGLRWAGLLLPQDKISEDLWTRATPDPGAPGDLLVAVHFRSGLAPDERREVIARYFAIEQTYGPLSVFALRIPRASLERLAMEPSVRWLEAIPANSFPLPAAP